MQRKKTNIFEALNLGERENIAIVGGGGKTSLMFRLAQALTSRGCKVLLTTTTKVWRKEAEEAASIYLLDKDLAWESKLGREMAKSGSVFLGKVVLSDGKVAGIDPGVIDHLYGNRIANYLLVEADGAAGRPVKVPSLNEPVVPKTTTVVIAVLGADAIGKPFGPEWVFREKEFESLTGIKKGQPLTAGKMEKIFLKPEGLFKDKPPSAKSVVFLNRLDLVTDLAQVEELASRLLAPGPYNNVDRVILGSLLKDFYIMFGA